MSTPTTEQAREAVNVFASIDVLGLLSAQGYPNVVGSIEDAIKKHYYDLLEFDPDMMIGFIRPGVMNLPMQKWDANTLSYAIDPAWQMMIDRAKEIANEKNTAQHKRFFSTSGTKNLLNDYVRLIANRGNTQGWKLGINDSDVETFEGVKYLTSTYNLSVKVKADQWIRWWANSITPFSGMQCIIAKISKYNSPRDLPELKHQQNVTVPYRFPSGETNAEGTISYHTETQSAFSRMGQLKPMGQTKIQYDILFNMVDSKGFIIASFQVDPEIIVVT